MRTLTELNGKNGNLNADCRFHIQDVWADNLEQEMHRIRHLIDQYPIVAMDTEFPGVVARPIGQFKTSADYHYQTLRCNVDLLKIIQVGFTFSNERGEVPKDTCTWQFNFKFNLHDDMYAHDSIELLTKSGIDFKRHELQGIDVADFGEVLVSSGMVLLDSVKWISFHGGYDFGYLLKLLTCESMAQQELDFFRRLHLFFPCIYDIKYMMKSCKNLKGGLQDVADDLKVERVGPQHQAGSDSLLTALTFFKLRKQFFDDRIDDEKFRGHIYGLGQHSTTTSSSSSSTSTKEQQLIQSQ